MKTKNNVQKAFLRTVAVIVSFVLLSITVTAQGYWKQLLTNNSFNHIASALVDHSKAATENEIQTVNANADFDFESFYSTELENSLKIQPWMVAEPVSLGNWNIDAAAEPGLEIENWMFNDLAKQVNIEQEENLQLEDWMMSSRI